MSEQEEILDVNEQIAVRKAKLAELREQGVAYPNGFQPSITAAELHAQYDEAAAETLEQHTAEVLVAGRIMTRRVMGKASFVHLQDRSGRIQAYIRRDELPEGVYENFKSWDLGDIVGVRGKLFKTKTGELSIKASDIELLTKALRPLPDKYHGLSDQEMCYRQRYLDLMVNEKTRQTFLVRSKIVAAIRNYLLARDFIEVETPMMQVIPGGATAKPFVTHHNALDMPLYLRVAPELFLKRLVVGGFERVFEINRNFRNEGLSTRHNPEFTMLEFYQAYASYHDLMDLTENMLREVAEAVLSTQVLEYQGRRYDLSQPFKRMTVLEAILHYNTDLQREQLLEIDSLREIASNLGIDVKPDYGIGKLQIEVFEKTAEHQLYDPTFITAYPTEVSPLARRNTEDPSVTDRFEFFVAGREMANGFSELNDPEDQAERFREQVKAKEAGDTEAMHYDADYITALEHGLPPTAGEGIGIDRLVMFFTDSPSIRDVILFPHMRKKVE